MTRITGLDPISDRNQNTLKLDSVKDIKDFLRQFSSISQAKQAIGAVLEEIRKIDPELAKKLEKLLTMLDKAEKQGMTLQDFIDNLEKIMTNEGAAGQMITPIQQSQAIFNDNAAIDTSKVNRTSTIV